MDLPTAPTSHFPYAASLLLFAGFAAAATIGSIAWFASKRPVGWKGTGAPKPKDELETDGYDRFMISAETAERQAREGQSFGSTPESEGNFNTTNGYTVDREGLANNHAIVPEIYAEVPGDMRERNQAVEEARANKRREVQQTDEDGELTVHADTRGKGVGVI
ncbi:MAG: photosystem II assembly protein Psb35 [Geitlerinemataceae cyanobacterium]